MMRRLLCLAALVALAGCSHVQRGAGAARTPDILFVDGDTVLFMGDSITDCGRRDVAAPYGNGYALAVITRVQSAYPDRNITWYNRGISGHTVLDLAARWEQDAVALDPDWMSLLIGINDLHRNLEGRPGLSPAEYEAKLDALLGRVVSATGCRLILLDPFYMALPPGDDEYQGAVLALLPEYIAAVDRLAAKYNAIHIKTHEILAARIRESGVAAVCGEPVHPNPSGHALMADAFLAAIRVK